MVAHVHTPSDLGGIMSGPVVKINKDLELDGALVLVCFPSVGMVSSIVAHYFIDNLDLKFVGGVVDERLPSICLVKDGAPMPAIRIYAGEPVCRVDDCDKLVIIMTELVIAPNLAHGIAEAMLEWSKASNAVMGVLIDAFAQGGGPAMNGQSPVVDYEDTDAIDLLGIGSTAAMRERLEAMEVPLLQHGVINGVSAALLSEARRRRLEVMSLLVEAETRFPDARAAAELIKVLDHLLPIMDLDESPLNEEAEELEAQIKAMMETQVTPEPSPSSNPMLYG